MQRLYDEILPKLAEQGYKPQIFVSAIEGEGLSLQGGRVLCLPASLEDLTEDTSSGLREGKVTLKPTRLHIDFTYKEDMTGPSHCSVTVDLQRMKASSRCGLDSDSHVAIAKVFRQHGWDYEIKRLVFGQPKF